MKPLTEREHQVMQLLCLGHSNKSMAERCGCSPKTIEKHRQAIYYKWKANSVVAMIRLALRTGQLSWIDFVSSNIGEDVQHEMPQHLERVIA